MSRAWQTPSLCSSKWDLSHSVQDGADNQYLTLTLVNGTSIGAPDLVSGQDANIQIFGQLEDGPRGRRASAVVG